MRLTAHADYGDCAYRRVISSGVVTTTYGYDAFGQRVIQTGTSTTTLYPFKWYSVASSTGTGAKYATTTDYVFSGDTLLATVDQQTASGVATGTAKTRYIHPDHLGSTNVVTDENDNVVQTLDYYPYGSTRISTNSGTNEQRKYIGQFADQSGLDYLNARYYDSSRGQFTTQDPVFLGNPKEQDLTNPQSLNSYAYANDNPIAKEDPTGRGAGPVGVALAGLLTSLAIALIGLLNFLSTPLGQVTVANVHDQVPVLTSPASSATQKSFAAFSISLSLAVPESGEGSLARQAEEEMLATQEANSTKEIISGSKALTSTDLKFSKQAFQKGQLQQRGWSQSSVQETVESPYTTRPSVNRTNNNNPATTYYNKDGSYVVVDDTTNEVVQVSDRSSPATWIPDRDISNPYKP